MVLNMLLWCRWWYARRAAAVLRRLDRSKHCYRYCCCLWQRWSQANAEHGCAASLQHLPQRLWRSAL